MPIVLVTGATGQQGGAVVRALLHSDVPGLTIRALTRNPHSIAAQGLAKNGVKLLKGDLFDRDSLRVALKGCDSAHLVTDFRNPEDIAGELKQGRNFIDCAKDVGKSWHLVLCSVAGGEGVRAVEHFYSKYQIEEMLRTSGVSWTIIRPAGFMDIIPAGRVPRFFFLGAMAAVFGKSKQKWIACEDIRKAVAKALLDPKQFRGQSFTIAGQVADIDEVQTALDKASGMKSWRMWLPRFLVLWLSPYHYRQMFRWLETGAQEGDVVQTKQLVQDVLDIERWARLQDGSNELS